MSHTYFTDRDLGKAFPRALRAAGISVQAHLDHFMPDVPDAIWLAETGRRGWVALTHNLRIRYTPNEQVAVRQARARLLVLIGTCSTVQLAENFIRTLPRIEAFLAGREPPFIARVYRPSPQEVARRAAAPGRIERWVSW